MEARTLNRLPFAGDFCRKPTQKLSLCRETPPRAEIVSLQKAGQDQNFQVHQEEGQHLCKLALEANKVDLSAIGPKIRRKVKVKTVHAAEL